jgi:hypothetical protein
MNSIHWNSVNHDQVSRVADWPYLTFHRYVAGGVYLPDWGSESSVDPSQWESPEFGESSWSSASRLNAVGWALPAEYHRWVFAKVGDAHANVWDTA